MHPATLLAESGPTLASGLDGFRLILHVLAATVWVGGQFTVAAPGQQLCAASDAAVTVE